MQKSGRSPNFIPEFSVATCISNPNIYQKCLLSPLPQSDKVEIIPIYNIKKQYSAASAMNTAIKLSKAKYFISCHQDITLISKKFFDKALDVISSLPDSWAVLGCSAVSDDGSPIGKVWSNSNYDSICWNGSTDLVKVTNVDECMMIINLQHNLLFDNEKFNGFHFYGVDLCLQAIDLGLDIYATCLPIIHHGAYSVSLAKDKRYWVYLRRLHKKWSSMFPEVNMTHARWNKNGIMSTIPLTISSDDEMIVRISDFEINEIEIEGEYD